MSSWSAAAEGSDKIVLWKYLARHAGFACDQNRRAGVSARFPSRSGGNCGSGPHGMRNRHEMASRAGSSRALLMALGLECHRSVTLGCLEDEWADGRPTANRHR